MKSSPTCLLLALMLMLVSIAGLVARSAGAATGGGVVENVPGGSIDWNRGCITATGNRTSLEKESGGELGRQVLVTAARVAAQENLLQAAKWVRLDSRMRVSDALSGDSTLLNRLVDLVVAAPVARQESLADGSATVTIELPLNGAFAALVLPDEIEPFSTLHPLAPVAGSATGEAGHPPQAKVGTPPYSGLLLDATSLKANPALVVKVFDERGREVFGPAFVNREDAIRAGVCGYDRSPRSATEMARLGTNPLTAKGLRAEGDGACDLVISNADAALLRSAPQHLAFFRRCAVVILLR